MWSGRVEEVRADESSKAVCVGRWMVESVWRSFECWREECGVGRVLRGVMSRWAERGLSQCVRSWVCFVKERVEAVGMLGVCLGKWEQREVHCGFVVWRGVAGERRRMAVAVRRMVRGSQVACMEVWRAECGERRRLMVEAGGVARVN